MSALARPKKYVRTFFFIVLVRIWVFLGKGTSKTRGNKNTREIFFRGGIIFTFSLSTFFIALVKRLSVRRTQKCDYKCLRGRASKIFPLFDFLVLHFWAFLDKGNKKIASRNRTSKKKSRYV
jgi:hypothetical protein